MIASQEADGTVRYGAFPRRVHRADQRGAGFVEYLIVIGLVALLCVAAFRLFGGAVSQAVHTQAECVANLESCRVGGDAPRPDRTVAPATSDNGTVTLVRTAVSTTQPLLEAPADDGEIIRVDSRGFQKISDGIRYPFDAYPEDVKAFLQQDRTRPLLPEKLQQSFDGFVRMYGGNSKSQSTLRDFQRLLADYQKTFGDATQPIPPDAVDEFFRDWSPTKKPTTTTVSSTSTRDVRQNSTTAPTEPSTSNATRPTSDRVTWINVDAIDWSKADESAFTLAASRLGFSADEIQLTLDKNRPIGFFHFDSDRSKTKQEWVAGQQVTRASLEAKARKGVSSVQLDGGRFLAAYTISENIRDDLADARKAIAGGFPSIQAYRDAQKPSEQPTGSDDGVWEGVKSLFKGAVGGDFAGEQGWSGLTGQTIVGFIPVVGQIADARDTISAIKDVVTGTDGGWFNLGMAGIAWIPGVGDVAKTVIRAGRKVDNAARTGIKEVFQQATRNADRPVTNSAEQLTKRTSPSVIDDVPRKVDDVPSRVDDVPRKVDTTPSKVDDLPSKPVSKQTDTPQKTKGEQQPKQSQDDYDTKTSLESDAPKQPKAPRPEINLSKAVDVAEEVYNGSSALQAAGKLIRAASNGTLKGAELDQAVRQFAETLKEGAKRKYGLDIEFVDNTAEVPNLSTWMPGAKGNYGTWIEADKKIILRKELFNDPDQLLKELQHEFGGFLLGQRYGGKSKIPIITEMKGLQQYQTHILDDFVEHGRKP